MGNDLHCPKCGCEELDVRKYESMVVVSRDHALFTMSCPSCGTRVSSMQPIPIEMRELVRYAAIEVGAGMGRE